MGGEEEGGGGGGIDPRVEYDSQSADSGNLSAEAAYHRGLTVEIFIGLWRNSARSMTLVPKYPCR